jgi:DNA helicase-2/ATP-dependent DNA helicase PcrA
MEEPEPSKNPAEEASDRALAEVYACLDNGRSFRLEAGAGAGKTYTLVKALQFLINHNSYTLPRRHQKIACITFTNTAKDEIEARTDRSPLIYCNTIHAFCWSLISGFQSQIKDQISRMTHWSEKIADVGDLGERIIEYNLGHRTITEGEVSIHHDDVLQLTVSLMENAKFRRILAEKYPFILIDEYQDTNAALIESIKTHLLCKPHSPQFGFFGDHWQMIYGDGCGKIEHPSLTVIGKEANFRSVSTIVDCLNRMRPELPQFVVDPNEQGRVQIFHSNNWGGARKNGQHWGGDLPDDAADTALQTVVERLTKDGWDFSAKAAKILMLTHRGLAVKQGYGTLPSVFAYNDSFTKKEYPHIAFFADSLEPACEAFVSKKYGEMFKVLGGSVPAIRNRADKEKWSSSMAQLIELRDQGTVRDVIGFLQQSQKPILPDAVIRLEQELRQFDRSAGVEMPRNLTELESLHVVGYREIVALCRYLSGHSPFQTKHGVKGAEFEAVLVVIGRGWNQYNFNEMLELAWKVDTIPANKQATFHRNRNLFYVACSRPMKRLAILFTQELSDRGLQMVRNWFGAGAVEALGF